LDDRPRIFEENDEDDVYIDSSDSGESEYDLDYRYNNNDDNKSNNGNTITQNEID
jgi:hypothetical protein